MFQLPKVFVSVLALGVLSFVLVRGPKTEEPAGPAALVVAFEPLALWPGTPPGDKGDLGEEKDTTQRDPKTPPEREVIRLGNVSRPTITLFKPPAAKDTGAAVVVCPGGGYHILAYDLEGTEICAWLDSIGVTGVLLKYRVPVRAGRERYAAPLEDAQRAVGLVRHRSKEWGLDPKRIGILGFSAGGHLAALAGTSFEKRAYAPVDEADRESCRPDFSILIYPAYLAREGNLSQLSPELAVGPGTPPAFIAMTMDDPIHVENAFTYALALKNAKVPVELHIYPTGGHGYGLRPSKEAVVSWPARAAEWLEAQGWLARRS